MQAVERFLALGHRWFTPDNWHRVPFQPVLYFFLWGATVRVVFTETNRPINFDILTRHTEYVWMGMALVCPPLALASWYLIRRCTFTMSTLIGMWVRLIADLGQFIVLVVYHLVMAQENWPTDGEIFARYLTGACLLFTLLLFVRDVWALLLTERVAGAIWDVEQQQRFDTDA